MVERKNTSIARILAKAERLAKEKRTTLVDELNEECAHGKCELFDMESVNMQIRKLRHSESTREEFFREAFVLFDKITAPDARAERAFHPSQLKSGCVRAMYYDLRGDKPTDHPLSTITGDLQRTFDVGSWYHLYIQNKLYKMGVLKQAEVPVVNKKKFINGKADGLFYDEVFGTKTILEIKTMNDFNFKKATFAPFKMHEFQASIYARELGASKILYLYINKNTSEIHDFLRPINTEQLEEADKKMAKVLNALKAKKAPRVSCRDPYSENAISCPFRSKCFPKD